MNQVEVQLVQNAKGIATFDGICITDADRHAATSHSVEELAQQYTHETFEATILEVEAQKRQPGLLSKDGPIARIIKLGVIKRMGPMSSNARGQV